MIKMSWEERAPPARKRTWHLTDRAEKPAVILPDKEREAVKKPPLFID